MNTKILVSIQTQKIQSQEYTSYLRLFIVGGSQNSQLLKKLVRIESGGFIGRIKVCLQ